MAHPRRYPSHNMICSKCKGKGSKLSASMECPGYQGSGTKISIRHLRTSMIQQIQHACNECKGNGEANDKNCCLQCKGKKVVQEKEVLEVIVEKGVQNGHRITFSGEANEAARLMCPFPISFLCMFSRFKIFLLFLER